MPSEFNPYRQWLGIDLRGQTPNYYQLLGLPDFEANPEAIWAAAYQRRAILRAEQYGDHADLAKRLLEEIDVAEACLLNPGRKTDYDKALRSGEAPPLTKSPAAGQTAERSSGGRRPDRQSQRRLKPGSKGASEAEEPPARADAPPAREPRPSEPLEPILTADEQPKGPKSAWGYDDGVPFRPEVADPAASGGAPMAAPMRPEDFLPPPASPASFSPPSGFPPPGGPPVAGVPSAMPPGAWAGAPPMAGVPAAPPMGAAPMAAPAMPGYPSAAPAPYPQYGSAPPTVAQPPWGGASSAPPAGIPAATAYPAAAVPVASAVAQGELLAQPAGSYPQTSPYGQTATSAAPLAAPYGATSPRAAVPTTAAPAGPDLRSSSPRRVTARRQSSARYALGGFLAVVGLGVLVILALNRGPRHNQHPVAQHPGGEDTLNHTTDPKTPVLNVDPPNKIEKEPTEVPMKEPPGKEPSKEPTENPMPKKQPAVEPKEQQPKQKEQPKPAQSEAVTAALMAARYHLAERELDKVKGFVAAARQSDSSGTQRDEIARVDSLTHYVGEFWKAVIAKCKALDGGDSLTIQGITIGFVEANDDYVVFRRAGRNEKHYYFRSSAGPPMKTGLAVGLAELQLVKDNAVTHLILGAFKTVNPTSDRGEARQHWQTASNMGDDEIKQTVRVLMPELDVTIPKELPSAPSVVGTPSDPVDGGKPKPPAGDLLVKAQEAMREKYKKELAAAVFEADKAALAEALQEAAGGEGLDAAARYALLLEARDQAAAGRKPTLALEVVAAIDERYTVDALALKIDALAAAQKSADDDADANKEVAAAAMALADEAALLEKFSQASRLAAMALQTARKAKDAALLKDATEREKQIRALKPTTKS
jgi:hypothetical protein